MRRVIGANSASLLVNSVDQTLYHVKPQLQPQRHDQLLVLQLRAVNKLDLVILRVELDDHILVVEHVIINDCISLFAGFFKCLGTATDERPEGLVVVVVVGLDQAYCVALVVVALHPGADGRATGAIAENQRFKLGNCPFGDLGSRERH